MLFGAVKVFSDMKRLEVIHILVDELRNRYLRQITMSFIPNQPHCEDIAQRGCDELRIFANQQFQPGCKILICAHGEMKPEIDLNVTPGYTVLFGKVHVPLPIAASRTVKLGGTVATVGF
jgi:hypothetical protein